MGDATNDRTPGDQLLLTTYFHQVRRLAEHVLRDVTLRPGSAPEDLGADNWEAIRGAAAAAELPGTPVVVAFLRRGSRLLANMSGVFPALDDASPRLVELVRRDDVGRAVMHVDPEHVVFACGGIMADEITRTFWQKLGYEHRAESMVVFAWADEWAIEPTPRRSLVDDEEAS